MSKLTIIIPALNEENLIKKTLNSLNQQINKEFSVIVVDNGSVDNTKTLVLDFAISSSFPLTLTEEKKPGVGYARDKGSWQAIEMGAEFLAGTDADTILPTNWTESIYKGFENKNYDLLSGECDPFVEVKMDADNARFILKARSALFKNVKPYFRGANFAITSKMFKMAGGFKQPLTDDGKPAPGEDGALEISALQKGARISGCLATVFPHPRRYISNLQKISEFNGSVHEGGVVTQVRDETNLEKFLESVPVQVIDLFVDKISMSLFNEFVIEVFKNNTLKDLYWKKSLKTLSLFPASEIERDIATQVDKEFLWRKYNEVFFQNIRKMVEALDR